MLGRLVRVAENGIVTMTRSMVVMFWRNISMYAAWCSLFQASSRTVSLCTERRKRRRLSFLSSMVIVSMLFFTKDGFLATMAGSQTKLLSRIWASNQGRTDELEHEDDKDEDDKDEEEQDHLLVQRLVEEAEGEAPA